MGYINVRTLAIVTTLFISTSAVWSLQANEMTERLVENYQKLRQYSWSMRTEVRLQGQQQSVTMERMRYDLDGRLQATPTGGSGNLSAEMLQLVDALAQLGFSYAQPDPNRVQKFLQRASVWEGRRGEVGTIRVEGEGFLQTGDQVDLRGQNERPERLMVEASYQKTPVTIRADYRGLPSQGPNYVARLMVRLPSDGVDLIVENFDHQLSAAIAAGDVSILPEGTVLHVRLAQPLSSARNQSGQEFQAILDKDLRVHNKTAVPAGAQLVGELLNVEGSGKTSGRAKMALVLRAVSVNGQVVPIETNVLAFEAEATHRKDARRIGGGAGLGAIVGGIAGGGSGAAKGAVIGGGVGTAATLLTKGEEVEFGAEQMFSFNLLSEVEITPR
jgi:hypothetical protein